MTRVGRIAAGGVLAVPLMLLAGCGGGGGNVASTPTPPATTTTPTTTTPTTTTPVVTTPAVNYNDAEYQRSNAATDAGAITAYNAGATGTGVTVAVVDSGLASVGTEFNGRVSAASRGFGGNTTYTDESGHGTAVSAVIGAARNGSDIQGIAFASTILALRADTAGTCSTSDGCKFSDSTLTTAVDYARTNGAKVINLSLGGGAANSQLTAAITRATAAGIIVVISAGNDGSTNPDVFTQVAASSAANGLVIIAGSHDASGTISTFSDRAGTYGNYYLTALGDAVRSFDHTGQAYLYSGTSFSAPAISAAIALLEQAFPNLTAAQVVDLLYRSATDAGATGVDAVYGRGILNIARAFQPIGTTSLAGSAVAVSTTDTMTLSTAMGDAGARAQSIGSGIILDSYGRAFEMNLAARVRQMPAARPLRDGLRTDMLTRNTDLGAVQVSTTIARRFADMPWQGFAQRGMGAVNEMDRPTSGMVTSRLGGGLRSGFAFGQSAIALDQRLGDEASPSFLSARLPGSGADLSRRPGLAVAMRQRIGGFDIRMQAERGRIDPMDPAHSLSLTPAYAEMRVGAERRFGRLAIGVYLGTLAEARTLLGARLAPAMGSGGATTRFADVTARVMLGDGWTADAAMRRGWTQGDGGGILASARLQSLAASAGLARDTGMSRYGLRFALPTRVTGGGLGLVVPTSYDYDTGLVGYSNRFVSLAPTGRESDVEANMGLRVGEGWLESNLFWRRQPGNIATAPDDLGAGLRYNLTF